jgi:spermidine synthase
MQGLHLTADLYDCKGYACQGNSGLLIDAQALGELCRQSVANAELTIVDEKFFAFPDYQGLKSGVTGAVLLAESHLAIHTWPERNSVTLDVYVCNFSTDNSAKAERLMESLIIAFGPTQQSTNRILRGSADPVNQSDELLLEWLNPNSAYGYRASRRIETLRSAYQTIEVFDTPQFGKLFRLDGSYMTSERDEFFYHEPLVHPAAVAHPAPRSALVLGGGDGGSTEELLKHPSIERITIAELDSEVIRIARKHLASVHRGAFDDARVSLHIGDGFEFLNATSAHYDLIVLDLTDPDTPAHRLYTREFFELAASRLAPGGAMTLHIGSPVFAPARVQAILSDLHSVFKQVHAMGLYIPLYGSYWGMAVVSQTLNPLTLSREEVAAVIKARQLQHLDYYNPGVHSALFALPNFYQALVDAR